MADTREHVEALLPLVQELAQCFAHIPFDGTLDVEETPSTVRVLEDARMAQSTLQGVHTLLAASMREDELDATEPASLLVRQLVELYADVHWIGRTENGATPDIQALRAELSDARKMWKMLKKMSDRAEGFDTGRAARATEKRDEYEKEIEELQKAIQEQGGRPRGTPSITDLLVESGHSELAFYWSYQSNVAHGESLARNRGRDHPLMVEVGPSMARRSELLSMALVVAGLILEGAIDLLSLSGDARAALDAHMSEVMRRYADLLGPDVLLASDST